jgi:hypothetical protein
MPVTLPPGLLSRRQGRFSPVSDNAEDNRDRRRSGFAATAAAMLLGVAMTATRRRTRSK